MEVVVVVVVVGIETTVIKCNYWNKFILLTFKFYSQLLELICFVKYFNSIP